MSYNHIKFWAWLLLTNEFTMINQSRHRTWSLVGLNATFVAWDKLRFQGSIVLQSKDQIIVIFTRVICQIFKWSLHAVWRPCWLRVKRIKRRFFKWGKHHTFLIHKFLFYFLICWSLIFNHKWESIPWVNLRNSYSRSYFFSILIDGWIFVDRTLNVLRVSLPFFDRVITILKILLISGLIRLKRRVRLWF